MNIEYPAKQGGYVKRIILSTFLICGVMFAQGYWAEPVKLPEVINDTVFDDSLWDRFHAHISPDGSVMIQAKMDKQAIFEFALRV